MKKSTIFIVPTAKIPKPGKKRTYEEFADCQQAPGIAYVAQKKLKREREALRIRQLEHMKAKIDKELYDQKKLAEHHAAIEKQKQAKNKQESPNKPGGGKGPMFQFEPTQQSSQNIHKGQ